MALRFFKRLFPIKTKSLDEFVEVLKQEGCKSVTAEPVRKTKGGVFTASVGDIGTFEYSLLLQSSTATGRKIVYKEVCQKRFGSSRGLSDAGDRGKAALRLVVTADARLEAIKEKLPDITTDIIGPSGRFDEKLYQELHKDAEKHNIKPVELSS